MSRLKLIAAALLLVIFETYTASANEPTASFPEDAARTMPVAESVMVLTS
jgi:hypothetical protein